MHEKWITHPEPTSEKHNISMWWIEQSNYETWRDITSYALTMQPSFKMQHFCLSFHEGLSYQSLNSTCNKRSTSYCILQMPMPGVIWRNEWFKMCPSFLFIIVCSSLFFKEVVWSKTKTKLPKRAYNFLNTINGNVGHKQKLAGIVQIIMGSYMAPYIIVRHM